MTKTGYAEDTKIRANPDLLGEAAYRASLHVLPNYPSGDPRPDWDRLDEAARWSWSRPTQRP